MAIGGCEQLSWGKISASFFNHWEALSLLFVITVSDNSSKSIRSQFSLRTARLWLLPLTDGYGLIAKWRSKSRLVKSRPSPSPLVAALDIQSIVENSGEASSIVITLDDRSYDEKLGETMHEKNPVTPFFPSTAMAALYNTECRLGIINVITATAPFKWGFRKCRIHCLVTGEFPSSSRSKYRRYM